MAKNNALARITWRVSKAVGLMAIPAALLAQQQRTQQIFTYVMVAIAAISLENAP